MTQSAFFLKTNQWTNTQNDRFLWRWLSQKLKDSICRLPLNIFDVYAPDKRQQQSTKQKKKKNQKKKPKRRSAVCIRGFEFTRPEEDVAAEKMKNYMKRKNNISFMKGLHEYLSSLFPHPDLTPFPTPALLSPLPFSLTTSFILHWWTPSRAAGLDLRARRVRHYVVQRLTLRLLWHAY